MNLLNSKLGRRMFGGVVVLSLAAVGIATQTMAADVYVGANVPSNQLVPLSQISHATWDTLLKKYVDERGMVDYTTWKASAADVKNLDAYLAHLSSTNARGTKEEQLAFWINAYNAVTVRGILREYPTSSIRNHTAKLFGYNIWKNLKLIVAGKGYSLEHIEHEILRKMGEPRIHFAIVCASIGCPRLLNEAYDPKRLDAQLTTNAKAFFADRSKFQANADRRTIAVSPILQWFGEDYGRDQAAQLKRIAPWLPTAQDRQLAESGQARLSFLGYDWDLNDRK